MNNVFPIEIYPLDEDSLYEALMWALGEAENMVRITTDNHQYKLYVEELENAVKYVEGEKWRRKHER